MAAPLLKEPPSTAGTYTFTLKLRTVAGTTQKEFTLVINDALIAPVFKEPNSTIDLPYAVIGETYSYDMHEYLANGSTCSHPLIWYGVSYLPDGLSFNESTGVLSVAPTDSTPTALHYFTVHVRNDAGAASQSFKIQVYRRPAITSPETKLDLKAGVYFQWTPTCTGSGNWSATKLPTGLKFSEGNGSIYGTPTAPGTYNVTLKLTTNSELYAEKSLTLVVAENNSFNISETSEHTFYGRTEGYDETDLTAKKVTVKNTGYSALTLTYALTGANPSSFELSKSSDTLAPGESATFTVKPKVGLSEGTYTATVQVSSGSLASAFDVEFTVSKNIVSPTVTSTAASPMRWWASRGRISFRPPAPDRSPGRRTGRIPIHGRHGCTWIRPPALSPAHRQKANCKSLFMSKRATAGARTLKASSSRYMTSLPLPLR